MKMEGVEILRVCEMRERS